MGVNRPVAGQEESAAWSGTGSAFDPEYRADWLYGDSQPFPAESSASRLGRIESMLEQLGSISSGDVNAAMPTAGAGYTHGYRVPTVAEAEASQAVHQLAQYNTLKYYQWRENNGSPLPVLLPDLNDTPAAWVGAINEIQQVLMAEDIANGTARISANTNYSALGLNAEAMDAQIAANIAAGRDPSDGAAWYATKAVIYEVWNFASMGFVKRHDARLDAYANGEITRGNFWTATALDGAASVASAALGGYGTRAVIGRMGTGYAGSMTAGALVGGGIDTLQQATGMVTYAMTGGQAGQANYSFLQGGAAFAGGALVGGAFTFASRVPILNEPMKFQNPVVLSRGTVLSSNGFGSIERLRSPIIRADSSTPKLISNKFPGEALDPKGRSYGEVVIVDGRIRLSPNQPAPTKASFVVTKDGKLMIGNKHTSLSNNEDVLAAGQLKLRGDGKVTVVDNRSGHYRPTVDEAARYPEILRDLGLDLSQTRLQGFRFHVDDDGFVVRSEKLLEEILK